MWLHVYHTPVEANQEWSPAQRTEFDAAEVCQTAWHTSHWWPLPSRSSKKTLYGHPYPTCKHHTLLTVGPRIQLNHYGRKCTLTHFMTTWTTGYSTKKCSNWSDLISSVMCRNLDQYSIESASISMAMQEYICMHEHVCTFKSSPSISLTKDTNITHLYSVYKDAWCTLYRW